MKRLLILLIALMCFAPLASATVHNYNVTLNNEGEGLYSSLVISKANTQNITGIQSLVIEGCSPFLGRNPAYEKTGTFILKNQTNTTLGTGTYSTVYGDYKNDYCPYFGTITHTYTFSNYSNAYPSIVDTWTAFYSNQIGYYGNGAGSDPEPWKAVLTPNAAGNPGIAGGYTFTYIDLLEPPPAANFTGSPLAGVPPMNVAFTDTSTGELGTCSYNWSITPLTNVTGATGTLENHLATFTDPGNYTVSHGVTCAYGSDIETKTDYIWVYAANETETTYFYTYNPLSGYEIHNSNIYLNDIENGSWVNSTDDADGRLGITALSTHHINAYSDKEGFGDGELLNQIANGLSYPLIMFPSNVSNVSAGNVTLYINVIDTWAPGTPVSGATVSITYAWPAIQYGTTNEAGMISFTVPNNTVIQVAANKAGYTGVSDSVNSGTGSGGEASVSKTLYITKKTVTTAPTATTLPGGGTPTPQVTYLPHCDPSAADYDEALCRASKGGVGLNLLADYMDDLILLCIFVTIMYLLGFKLGS